MSTTIFCKKYQQTLEALSAPPFPGEKGQYIFANFSKQAWLDWQAHQTRLINEKHLNTMEKDDRKYLTEQRDKFFSGEAFDKADGYVPENTEK